MERSGRLDNLTPWLEDFSERRLGLNPAVLRSDLRARMRGGRPFAVLLLYTLLSCIPIGVALAFMAIIPDATGAASMTSLHTGRTMFTVLLYTELTLTLLLLPAFSAGSIALEREKRTLEMLNATLLKPADIFTGKFLGVLAFGMVMLVCSVPIAAWCVLLGDVGPDDLFYGYAFLFALTVWVAGFGTFMSAIMPRAISAVATTYVTMLVAPNLLAVIPGLALAFLAIWQDPKVWIGPAVQIGKAEILVVWTFAAAGVLYVIVRAWWRQGALQRPGAAARHVRRVAIGIVAVLWMALWLAAPVSLLVRGGMLGPVTMGASLSPYFGAAAILEPSTVQSIASEMETVLTRATSGSTGGSSGSRGPSGPSALAGTGPPVSRLQVCAVLIGGMLLAGLAFWVLGAAALTIRRR